MKLVFASSTPLAGMPWRTMMVCDRYLRANDEGWARSIVGRTDYGGKRKFPHDLIHGSEESKDVLADCDVIIVSAYMPDQSMGLHRYGKPIARHYSTEPFRWVEKVPDATRSTVVAQYQWRHAQHLTALPNLIPIDHDRWKPGPKPEDRVVIVYSPTSRANKGWANKGFGSTTEALRNLQKEYGNRVEILLLEGADYEDVMCCRRHAHIVIDECATGSYHSTALEGLACGAASVCWVDPYTRRALEQIISPEAMQELPFFEATLRDMEERLRTLVANPGLVESVGKASRSWMEIHYSEKYQAQSWLTWHQHFLERSLPTNKQN